MAIQAEMSKRGIQPDADYQTVESGTHLNAVMQVLNGRAEGAMLGMHPYLLMPPDMRQQLRVLIETPPLSSLMYLTHPRLRDAETLSIRKALLRFAASPDRTGFHAAWRLWRLYQCRWQRIACLPPLRTAGPEDAPEHPMKAWLERLSLRYKLTLAALAVEVVMFAFLIGNGVQFTNHALQQQADQRVHEIAETLAIALSTPMSQQDDISVRDIIESLQRDDDLIMIEVRDGNSRIVHQTSNGARISESDFRVLAAH